MSLFPLFVLGNGCKIVKKRPMGVGYTINGPKKPLRNAELFNRTLHQYVDARRGNASPKANNAYFCPNFASASSSSSSCAGNPVSSFTRRVLFPSEPLLFNILCNRVHELRYGEETRPFRRFGTII